VGRAGSLAGDDAAGDTYFHSVAKHKEVVDAADVDAAELVAAVSHWVTAHGDARAGVVGQPHQPIPSSVL
jgi:hypothetical protein